MAPASGDDPGADWRRGADVVGARIAAALRAGGRAGDTVHVVAAVKYQAPEDCPAIVAAGIGELAENRLDHLIATQDVFVANAASPQPEAWHFIGRVQSREVIELARRVDMIHALTSTRAVARLARAVEEDGLELPSLLVQVNVDGDPAKDGLAPSELPAWLDALPDQVRISGLMTMPAFADDPESSRPAFARLRALRDELRGQFQGRHELHALSMGTTQDFEVAVAEGATHVRLGRILASAAE